MMYFHPRNCEFWFVRLLDSPNLTFVKQSLFSQASKMKASDLPPKRPDFNSPCHMWYVQLWWASRGKLDTEILMWGWDEICPTMGGNWTILCNEQTRWNRVWSSNKIGQDSSSSSFLNLKYRTLFVQIHLWGKWALSGYYFYFTLWISTPASCSIRTKHFFEMISKSKSCMTLFPSSMLRLIWISCSLSKWRSHHHSDP